jgi:hypothetical protein
MPEAPPVRRYLLAYVMAGTLVGAGILGGIYYLTDHSARSNSSPTVHTNLTVMASNSTGKVPSGFFGINLRVEYPPDASPGTNLNGTPINFVRWPGGQVSERLDVLGGLIYADQGTTTPAATNATQFVHWCQVQHCRAIVELPTEIDNTSYAAKEVAAFTHATSTPFEPAYWELGNEPAGWTHFMIPWTEWNSTQNATVDAPEYAQVVSAYISAVRAVDPVAHFLGLGGLGRGSAGESAWISELASVDGSNLSAYAIHVYPAANASNSSKGLGQFYATLEGPASVPSRVPADRAAVAAACKSCPKSILLDELGSGTQGGPFDAWMGGYSEVPYIAAELIQALALNVSSTELFAYESSYPGSFVNATSGASNPIGMLYSQFFEGFPPREVNCSASGAVRGLYELAGGNPDGTNLSVLVVNTNPDTVQFNWSFKSRPPPGGSFSTLRWGPNQAAPSTSTGTVPVTLAVTVPSGGVWLWREGTGLAVAATAEGFHGPRGMHAPIPMLRGPPRADQTGVFTATRVSVPLMPGTRRTRWSTMSRASLTWPAWIFTMRSKGPVTASTSTTWGICRTRLRTSSRRPTSVSTNR